VITERQQQRQHFRQKLPVVQTPIVRSLTFTGLVYLCVWASHAILVEELDDSSSQHSMLCANAGLQKRHNIRVQHLQTLQLNIRGQYVGMFATASVSPVPDWQHLPAPAFLAILAL
jgi:hypothetical protein